MLLLLLPLLSVAALAAWLVSRRIQSASGLPARARVVYSDTRGWRRVEKPLFSQRHGLAGRPDYILELRGAAIPVEVKPNRDALEPLPGDVMQLAAYGLLIEEVYHTPPPHGLLKYRDRTFEISFTAELRAQLLSLIEEMRKGLDMGEVSRSHSDPARCRACGYRAECGQALDE